jgi:hypothetical protein
MENEKQEKKCIGPEKKFKAGCVSATVWLNKIVKDNKSFVQRTITLEKNFKDKNGNWKNNNCFNPNDLPKAEVVLRQAFKHSLVGVASK